jgi:uncharacterized protein YbgA (DUF1722 family)/uncharacterized protein YbbK (DUF523 family)
MAIRNPSTRIKIGVSSCLLGEKVRWDGNHKQDAVVKNQLGRIFEWVPTCPEVEIGMGIPREAVHLTGSSKSPRMVGTTTATDWTQRMNRYSKKRSRELAKMNVCGYIFKSKSPSCGIARIPVVAKNGKTQSKGRGLFAELFIQQYPLVPFEDEDRLHDARVRENFITRVFAYHRLTQLLKGRFSLKALVKFHTAHKFLLLAHSRKHYNALGKRVAQAKQIAQAELKSRYAEEFMQALTFRSTKKKNADVLYHMLGFFKTQLSRDEKLDLIETIEDYRNELTPLIVPVTLIKRHIRKHKIDYLSDQVYLDCLAQVYLC